MKKNNPPTKGQDVSFKQKMLDKIQHTKPILLFWGGFVLLFLLYFAITTFPFYESYILNPVSTAYAKVSSWILNLLGQATTSVEIQIRSAEFNMSVRKGCDGIAPTIFYMACVLLFPASLNQKWKGIIGGALILTVLNLVRVVSLFFFGKYLPDWFDFMHQEFWQVVYIASAVFLYGTWLYWAFNQNSAKPDNQLPNHP